MGDKVRPGSDILATPFEWRGSNWNPFKEGADATRNTGSGERYWHNVDEHTWVRRKVSPAAPAEDSLTAFGFGNEKEQMEKQ